MESRPWRRHYDYSTPDTVRYPRVPAHEMLNIPANSHPAKPAYDFYGSRMSFYDLRTQVLRLANALGGLGVKKGDRVGLHLPTSPQYLIAYHSALYVGAIVVNLNPMYTAHELKHLVSDTGVSTLITFDMVLSNIREVVKETDIERIIVTKVTDYIQGLGVSTSKDLDLEEGWIHFSELIEGCGDTRLPRVQTAPEDPAVIQFTGGTTGIPKGAVLTHSNVIAAAMQAFLWGQSTINYIPIDRRSVLAVLPYFHVYGMIVAMSWSLLSCATQILVPRFDIEEFMGILARFEDITFFPAVPTLINAIINHPKAGEMDLGRKIGLLNSGAAPMPVELIEQVRDMGIYYSEGWGMSETGAMGVANPVMGLKKTGSIGVPLPDNDLKLVSVEDGETEVKKGEPGEIIFRGPLVMKEYWNNPEETAGQLRDGWLYTGDIAVRDEDDYFFIVDRKKDMIIAGGYNIYPREIDEVLFEHPKVADAVCIGVADKYRGETVKAYVVVKPGESVEEKEIMDFCRERLAAYKIPKIIEFRDALPKSVVGKILRKVLREEEVQKAKDKK